MSRKSLNVAGITVLVLAFAAVAMAASLISVPPPGTICVKLAKMGHTFIPVGLPNGPFAPTNGSITAQVGQPIKTTDGRDGFNFAVIGFTSSGDVSGLGAVKISLDTSRRQPNSTFIENTNGKDSTQTINFNATFEVNGKTYRNAETITLIGTSVEAFPPPTGTAYALANKVTLVDAQGKAAYTLPVGQAASIQ
jgi:hypothetical protein